MKGLVLKSELKDLSFTTSAGVEVMTTREVSLEMVFSLVNHWTQWTVPDTNFGRHVYSLFCNYFDNHKPSQLLQSPNSTENKLNLCTWHMRYLFGDISIILINLLE